jgi:tRNA 2-thiouridine synthesizing protein D
MQLAIVVYSAPEHGQSAWSAFKFATAALEAGHQLYRVFFYHDGVYNGADNHLPPQDECALPRCWQQLAQAHDLDLVVCVSAAKRRGIFNDAEAKRQGSAANLINEFDLSGLGQYTDALLKADRTITFGPPA